MNNDDNNNSRTSIDNKDSCFNIDIVPIIVQLLKVENRIILISKHSGIIDCAIANSDEEIDVSQFKGNSLNSVCDGDIFDVDMDSSFEFHGTLIHPAFVNVENDEAHINISRIANQTIVVITLFPETRMLTHEKRILFLVSSLKQQFDDNPQSVGSILGLYNAAEVSSLYRELEGYMIKHGITTYSNPTK